MTEVRKERQMQQIENSKTADSSPTVDNHCKCEWSEGTLLKEIFRLDKKARPESMSSTRNPLKYKIVWIKAKGCSCYIENSAAIPQKVICRITI